MTDQDTLRFADVALSAIRTGPQPRTVFDPEEMELLTASIADLGLLQPLLLTVHPDEPGAFLLLAGERRLRALTALRRDRAPALIRAADGTGVLATLAENTARTPLNALEEAGAYRALIDEHGYTHEQVAAAVGKSRSHITHLLNLQRLPEQVQRRIAAGVLSTGHAKVLLSIRDPHVAARLAERIVAEGLSVASTAELVRLGNLPGAEDDRPRPRRLSPPRTLPGTLADTERRLEDALDTQVRIQAGKSRGKVVIHFGDEDDLRRILDQLTQLRAAGPLAG